MGSHTDSCTANAAGYSTHGSSIQPICSQGKKVAAQTESNKRDIMATIADDDDRLLVRIGYTPVCSPIVCIADNADFEQGPAETLLTMVNSVLRNLDSRSAWISASNLWCSNDLWWASNMRVGMAHW